MRPRTLAAVLAASPLTLAGCHETARTVGSADVVAAPAPTIVEICGDSDDRWCLELYYALSAEAFGTGGGGLQELYERRKRRIEDWVQSNLENIGAGAFRAYHGTGGISDPAEYVRLRAEYRREEEERFQNFVSRRLRTTSYLKLAEEARQHVENTICREEHDNPFYRLLKRNKKVAPGHPDAGARLLSCADYAGPWREPFEVRIIGGDYNKAFSAWLREREGGAK